MSRIEYDPVAMETAIFLYESLKPKILECESLMDTSYIRNSKLKDAYNGLDDYSYENYKKLCRYTENGHYALLAGKSAYEYAEMVSEDNLNYYISFLFESAQNADLCEYDPVTGDLVMTSDKGKARFHFKNGNYEFETNLLNDNMTSAGKFGINNVARRITKEPYVNSKGEIIQKCEEYFYDDDTSDKNNCIIHVKKEITDKGKIYRTKTREFYTEDGRQYELKEEYLYDPDRDLEIKRIYTDAPIKPWKDRADLRFFGVPNETHEYANKGSRYKVNVFYDDDAKRTKHFAIEKEELYDNDPRLWHLGLKRD